MTPAPHGVDGNRARRQRVHRETISKHVAVGIARLSHRRPSSLSSPQLSSNVERWPHQQPTWTWVARATSPLQTRPIHNKERKPLLRPDGQPNTFPHSRILERRDGSAARRRRGGDGIAVVDEDAVQEKGTSSSWKIFRYLVYVLIAVGLLGVAY